MRIAGIEYEIKPSLAINAPKGRLPYIDDHGTTIVDSHFIVTYLKTTYKELDKHLSSSKNVVSRAMQNLLEEHLLWIGLYSRWQYSDENWQVNRKVIFGVLPPVIRDIVASRSRKKIIRQIYSQGMGRHQAEEIFTLGKQDLDALSVFLDDKPYFFGNQPTTLDASAFGLLINLIGCPIESPVKEHGRSKDNLKDYVDRIKLEFYPDLQMT